MKSILVIEDDHQTLEIILHFLRQHENVQAQGCTLLNEGIRFLDLIEPELVISDIHLPDGLGLEIMNRVNSLKKKPCIIFISGYIQEFKQQIPNSPKVTYLPKPLSLQTLWERAEEMIYQEEKGSPFRLGDYLQIAAQGRHSICIDWVDHGQIILKDGQVWTAKDGQGKGESALKRLVVRSEIYRDGGEIKCTNLATKSIGERTVFTNTQEILLNAISEEEELLANYPGSSETEMGEKEQLDHYIELGTNYLLDKDYPKALGCLLKAHELDPEHNVVKANVLRLQEMGIEPEEVP